MLERLNAVRFPDLPKVADGSGVPESTVRKLRYGEVKNPRVQTVQALHDYFERQYGASAEVSAHSAVAISGAPGAPATAIVPGQGQGHG